MARKIFSSILRIGLYALLFGVFLLPTFFIFSEFVPSESADGIPSSLRVFLEASTALAALLAAVAARLVFRKPRVQTFGLIKGSALIDGFMGLLIGCTLVSAVCLILYVAGVLTFNAYPELSILKTLGPALAALLLNTIFQNIAFRGYILGVLLENFRTYTAITVSSLLFVVVHAGVFGEPWPINLIGSANLFLAGVLLCVAYFKTSSLWMPIGIHFGWNAGWAILGVSVSGQELLSGPKMIALNGQPILTGANIGPEGSIIGLLGPLLGLVILNAVYRKPS